MLTREARAGQVLGRRTAAYGDIDRLAVAEPRVGGGDRAGEIRRHRRGGDGLAKRAPARGQVRDVRRVEVRERAHGERIEPRRAHEVPVGACGDGEAVGHAHACRTQAPVQLAERRILAADLSDIGQTDLREPANERLCGHGRLLV